MKFRISGTSKIPNKKAATFNYELFETSDINQLLEFVNTNAIVPVVLKGGHRRIDNIIEILPWLRLDVDEKGEAKRIEKALKKIWYIKKPSTSNDKNPYKWHYIIPIKNVSQNYDAYKLQYQAFLDEFKITMKDNAVASVVQNMQPYGKDGVTISMVNGGKGKKKWKAPDVVVPERKNNNDKKSSDASKDDVKKLLKKLDPDMDYRDWLKVGMSLYDWCPKRGLKLFDKWSSKSNKYDEDAVMDKWEDFSKNLKGDVTLGTLVHMVHGDEPKGADLFKAEKPKRTEAKDFDPTNVNGILTEALIRERQNQRVLFDNIVVERMHTFIYGSAGTNKTTIMGYIANHIVTNHDDKVVMFWSFDASQDHESSIYQYTKDNGNTEKVKLIVGATPAEYHKWCEDMIDGKVDLSHIVIIIDTFKFITTDVNNKNANQKAMHEIKAVLKLGATVICLGHTNKDAIKNSGTAEIEQDSDAILRVDREVDELSKDVTLSIKSAGRTRFNCKGVTFKSTPKGANYNYLYSALTSMRLSNEFIDIKHEDDKVKNKRDDDTIKLIRETITKLNNDPRLHPNKTMIITKMREDFSINHKKVEKVLTLHRGEEWDFEVVKSDSGKPTHIYKLKGRLK